MPLSRILSTAARPLAPSPVRTDAPEDAIALVPDADAVSLGGIGAALWRERVVATAVFGTAIALAVVFIAVSPVRYSASTSILLDPRLGKTVGADPTQPGFVADSSAIDSQLKLLTSQTVLSRVATTLHLDQDAQFSGSHFSVMRLLGMGSPPSAGVDLKALESAITIKRPERTYLVEIQASAASPDKAAAIANAVAEAYNEDQVSSRVVSTRNDAKFITQKRAALRTQINDAEHRIEDYKRQNNIVSTDGFRSNEQQVSDLTRELGASRGKLSELRARAEQVAAIARSGKLDASADALKSPTIERLRSTQADTERDFAKLSETLGPRHPALLESRAQVQRVKELIGAELQRQRQGAENDFQSEKRNETQLVAELDRIKRQSTDSSAKLVPLRQMERDVDALRQSDERFARIGDTLIQQEGDTPPARVLAEARPPVSPSWPRRSLILGVAGIAGLFFGLGAALLRDASKRPRARMAASVPPSATPVLAPARTYWAEDSTPAIAPAPVPAPVVAAPAKTPVGTSGSGFYRQLSTDTAEGPKRRLVWS